MTNDVAPKIIFSNVIKYYIKKFYSELKLAPVFGCELEFYTKKNLPIAELQEIVSDPKIKVIPEEGLNQFELLFAPTLRPFDLIDSIIAAKDKLKEIALFNAKPFSDQPSSALHLHINLLDETSTNIFERKNGHNTDYFIYSVGGLLHFMKASCVFFAPYHEDYQRYYIESMHTPSNVSWGINNRTTALRITTMEKGPRRIEHRLSSANVSPETVISLILMSIYTGIQDKIKPPLPIYGIAFDQQYSTEKLPQTLEEARILMMQSNIPDLLCIADTVNENL